LIENAMTIILGILAILLPALVASLMWKHFDRYFGRNDESYLNSLEYFLKKLSVTLIAAFIILWIGMSLVFS
jgi:preprotein translocase subunit SecG